MEQATKDAIVGAILFIIAIFNGLLLFSIFSPLFISNSDFSVESVERINQENSIYKIPYPYKELIFYTENGAKHFFNADYEYVFANVKVTSYNKDTLEKRVDIFPRKSVREITKISAP